MKLKEHTFNFLDAYTLKVDFPDTGASLHIHGSLMSDNKTFLASMNDVRKCTFLDYAEQNKLADSLVNRTRNDRLKIMFDE